jgi:hypothetical protein
VSEGAAAAPDLRALLAPQRALRVRFEAFRAALARDDRAAEQRALDEFEAALRRRIESELRVLVPALARAVLAGGTARRELEVECVQLRELTSHLAQRVAGGARAGTARAEILGLAANLDRRLAAHESEMERVYGPAALPELSDADRSALARDA